MAPDDIEDIVAAAGDDGDANVRRADVQASVVWKHRRRPGDDRADEVRLSPFLTRSQRVLVKTWGCSHNNSDGEYMQGQLAHAGYMLVDSVDEADLCVFNSCTVKDPSEMVFRNAIRQAQAAGKKVVLAGCVPQADQSNPVYKELSVIGVQQIDRIVEVVEHTLQGNVVRIMSRQKSGGGSRLALPKIRRNRFIEILPINTGCLNNCTYCKTKHARGELSSYPPDEIVERARQAIDEGVREIWLSSEDTGAYGHDIGTSLPDMLWRVIDVLPDGVFLRIGMTNPPHIMSHLDQMCKILRHPRVYAFLHVPVQAGSTRVLDAMKRDYSVDDFRTLVDILRRQVPDIQIATDVICGFPTETDEEFGETVSLIREYQFPAVHISQFYARQGTPAARMARVPSHVIKSRSRLISSVFASYETHAHKVGRVYRVLCTERAADDVHLVAHNKSYDQILVPDDERLMGRCFRVRITEAHRFHMVGHVISGSIEGRQRAPVRSYSVAARVVIAFLVFGIAAVLRLLRYDVVPLPFPSV
ncbi:Threonylcarbamoyladenosine tRNA methylthiotransferase [Plasmodiophora brassicae]|uniref:Threonylcarbamoyladenosine tRNA methylthiotransferase n=1 Tax=Plasmodiophora brassicae TaxID=37360 RepID=A0A0G4J0E5_PLABS|nr:hypothetical protein PBRA_001800 [Plasmodiophora brassicae]SPQ93773.1 unnamed protein product [Plasmodiophora brassicae]